MNISWRESIPHYIGADDADIKSMLKELGHQNLDELFHNLPQELRLEKLLLEQSYDEEELRSHLLKLSQKNKIYPSFVCDALNQSHINQRLHQELCSIRGLTTAYTPYQAERSQGTLESLWLYQSLLGELSGFEAINASLYERSSAIFEAIKTAIRLHRTSKHILLPESLYEADKEVLRTLVCETQIQLHWLAFDPKTGLIKIDELEQALNEKEFAALLLPQINSFGLLEDVDQITDLAHQFHTKLIALIDPLLIGPGGLKPPVEFGKKGADIFIAEGQHLALDPNFGGPGLGIFGVRFNEEDRLSLRQSPGRFIGKAKDLQGRDAKVIVLSTREQHIRRSKATSNICSNQSFVATLAAGQLLNKGSQGLKQSFQNLRQTTDQLYKELLQFEGVCAYFETTPFVYEFLLKLNKPVDLFLEDAYAQKIQPGIDLSTYFQDNVLKVSVHENITSSDISKLIDFFGSQFEKRDPPAISISSIPSQYLRKSPCDFPHFKEEEIIEYFRKLGNQNLSPDDGPYPLGSCTMKYNPWINDWAASLEGFSKIHPQSPTGWCQGSLEILFHIQEMFKAITGLSAVTTEPLSGAQGELVGLKMFQAYHRDQGQGEDRRFILIPKSAHGTNPATASVAGYDIIEFRALPNGEMDLEHLKEIVQEKASEIAGIMVTNPNTSGIFESQFKEMSELMHSIGALVYMDGANMNAIAGHINLRKLGVDAVHNNLHKTWSIPHGGGGPGDAIVAVSDKLAPYLPGVQIVKQGELYRPLKTEKSIGRFHRHWGNFAHKVRCYTYLKRLGEQGVKKMSATAVLSARYLYQRLKQHFPTLPMDQSQKRMHEFIITLSPDLFEKIQAQGIPKALIIPRVGKLFLDFGLHAPTVAFPESYGLMIEPTESYSKKELDHFIDAVIAIKKLIEEHPEVLLTVPHFTPIARVDEVSANKNLILQEKIRSLSTPLADRLDHRTLYHTSASDICALILKAHKENL